MASGPWSPAAMSFDLQPLRDALDDDGQGEGKADEEAEPQPRARCGNNRVPPRPVHYVLRPGSDPRIDKGMFVRYDALPERKTGAIIIVIPGGNYDESDIYGDEAQPVAQWLAECGVTAVVLQYRCVSQGHYWPAQFEDWSECARAVRGQAASWGCDAERVGVIGFSAGGHLAAYAAAKAEPAIRPKFQILVYPAIDTLSPRKSDAMEPWRASQGYPPVEASIHLILGKDAPPTFAAGMTTDELTPADENTDVLAAALRELGVPCEYVRHEEGEHGCGLQDWWTAPCEAWLQGHGWASAAEDGKDSAA